VKSSAPVSSKPLVEVQEGSNNDDDDDTTSNNNTPAPAPPEGPASSSGFQQIRGRGSFRYGGSSISGMNDEASTMYADDYERRITSAAAARGSNTFTSIGSKDRPKKIEGYEEN